MSTKDALVVSATRLIDEGGPEHVTLREVGRRSGGMVEILEGVKEGDEVVTAGQNRLSNNAPVTVDNSVEPKPDTGTAIAP